MSAGYRHVGVQVGFTGCGVGVQVDIARCARDANGRAVFQSQQNYLDLEVSDIVPVLLGLQLPFLMLHHTGSRPRGAAVTAGCRSSGINQRLALLPFSLKVRQNSSFKPQRALVVSDVGKSGAEGPSSLPIEEKTPAVAMDAKLMVATDRGDVQQLKDLLNKEDSAMLVVVMASSNQAASTARPHPVVMDPHLLALACSGSYKKLESLLSGEDSQASGDGAGKSLPVRRASDDTEANESILERVTVEGDSSNQVASTARPHPAVMYPQLLALPCTGSSEEPQSLLNRADGQTSGNGTDGNLAMQQASDDIEANESILESVNGEGDIALVCTGSEEPQTQTLLNGKDSQASGDSTNGSLPMQRALDDIEANESILKGVTAEGDTALHVVATYVQGDNFFTRSREAKHLLVQNNRKRRMLPSERHALTTYGDNERFLESARIIYRKAKYLLFEQNKNGDTPLHCAAQAGKSNMVSCLIELAKGEDRVKELLRKENKHKETALHKAVHAGNNDIVELLMELDSELASFPEDAASPLYLAILLNHNSIVDTLYNKSDKEKLSYSGQNGQNALHAAVLRGPGLTNKLLKWNKDLTTQKDENGSTALHFAAALKLSVCRQVLQANAEALYQPDHAGLFPIHVAASVDVFGKANMFVQKCPSSAGLRDAKGRTFLHVAVDKKLPSIVDGACRNLSLSWIMNMRDNDGNTALHLAVEAGSLQMFCPLLRNPQVNLNLPNNKGETPLDIAHYMLPPRERLYYNQSSEQQICRTLNLCGAVRGACRQDHFGDNKTLRIKQDERKEMEILKDSTQTLFIGSVLIASVTFGATFAVPGGYIADDHNNGGTPIFARRYAFDAFIRSNTLAFVFSVMAIISLMCAGLPSFNPRSRIVHLGTAFYLVSISITSLAAAFALGAFVVLAPVAHKTAVAICVLSSLVLLHKNLEFIGRRLLLLPPLCARKGLIWGVLYSSLLIMVSLLIEHWPLLFIFVPHMQALLQK